MLKEDFSFAMVTSTNPTALSTLAPSLWRVSSLDYSDCREDEDYGGFSRKSFSYVESEVMNKECEEKMDMLWEDFNEELRRVCSLDKKKGLERLSTAAGCDSTMSDEYETGGMVELCCVRTLKMSKPGFGMVYPKRRSMVVVLKVLKKLFFLHNLAGVKKIKS